jgi:N-acetyl-anhydromuramyl-L-alanine amidase AmpD
MIVALTLLFQLAGPIVVQRPIAKCQIRDTSATYVVVHYDSADATNITWHWLHRKKLSYNYYVQRDGTVVEMLAPQCKANHAGVSRWDGHWMLNNVSVGIALQDIPPAPYSTKQYDSLAWLIVSLENRWPFLRTHPAVGHDQIAIPRGRKRDPGPLFRWAYLDTILARHRSYLPYVCDSYNYNDLTNVIWQTDLNMPPTSGLPMFMSNAMNVFFSGVSSTTHRNTTCVPSN